VNSFLRFFLARSWFAVEWGLVFLIPAGAGGADVKSSGPVFGWWNKTLEAME